MLTHNLCRKADSLIRLKCSICVYIQREFVEICNLTDTCVFNGDIYPFNRGKYGINRNHVDCHFFSLVLIRTYISTTIYNSHFYVELTVSSTVQCSNDLILIDDLKIRITFDICRCNYTFTICINVHHFCLIQVVAVIFDCQTFDVHNNLRNIFLHTRNRTEFMDHTINFDVTYRCSRQR